MIYFDNSATSRVHPEVYEAMIPYLTLEYGNPSSKYYALARNAQQAVEDARENVAKLIGAKTEEIIFTAGASESSNMIIKGVADYRKFYEQKGNHIITSTVEHKATLNTCRFLNGEIYSNHDATFSLSGQKQRINRGFEVDFVPVNEYGQTTCDILSPFIRPTTTLASFIWANNEIGTLNDVKSLAALCHKSNVLFHADATQVIGKHPCNAHELDLDFMSLSAHKLNGPKGIGAAYIKSDDYGLPPFTALLHGGEQENGTRAGTLAVHNIVGFGKAAQLALSMQHNHNQDVEHLDTRIKQMIAKQQNLQLIGHPSKRLPCVYSIIVNAADFNNERFLKYVSDDFALSSGSACTAGEPSHVLQAIGLGDKTSKVLRISIDPKESPTIIETELNNLFNKITAASLL